MTDCSSIHGSSSSSDVTSSHGATPRIRIIRLCRPNVATRRPAVISSQNTSFGFAIRGGREFTIGFFVSRIEKGSEADMRGLRVGDQIIRVNGYLVDDAVHKELSQYMSCQDRLTLKVRGVGMIPIKDRNTDPLTWHIVPLRALTSIGGLDEYTCHDVRVTLNVAPRSKLGLGICKGPEWKPGIFVQFTKEFGIAREAGLRPGDQLLSCNDIDFSNILFSEAVAVMKASHSLELLVRTSAGLDLFPGESSGYNSSASSVTGDQSPCWGDQASKRLSIVKEEDGTDKLGYLRPKNWERKDLDRRKERLHVVESPKIPSTYNQKEYQPIPKNNENNNTTIIRLSENGTVINNTIIPNKISHDKQYTTVHLENGENVTIKENSHSSKNNIKVNISNSKDVCGDQTNGTKLADICFVSRQCETKTVIVEVHRSSNEDTGSNIPPPPPISFSQDRNSLSSSMSIPSSCDGSSLSSAISDELKKRAERTKYDLNASNDIINANQNKLLTKKIKSPIGGQSSETHNALMDEFQQAHKKMFRNGFVESEGKFKIDEKERQNELRKIVNTDVCDSGFDNKSSNGKIFSAKPLSTKVDNTPQSHPTTPIPDYDVSPAMTLNNRFTSTNGGSSPRTLNGSMKGTMGRCAASEIAKANGDTAEMESIESYKFTNPSSPQPKPPSLYFNPQSSGPPSMKKSNRQVSVSIGEYTDRKEPSKFNFISKSVDLKTGDVSDRLKNELENTLSRSNLRAKNENESSKENGTKLTINQSCPSNLNEEKSVIQKSQSNVEKITAMLVSQNLMGSNNNGVVNKNRVTLNLPNKQILRKVDSSPINGILKNGTATTNGNNSEHKNISFGNITTTVMTEDS